MAGLRIVEWVSFGAVYGAIVFGLIAGLASIIFLATGDLLVIPFVLIGGIIIGAILGAIGFAIFGIIYDIFLVGFLKRFGLFGQILSASLIISIATALLAQAQLNLIVEVVSSVIGAVFFVIIVGIFKLKTPFRGV